MQENEEQTTSPPQPKELCTIRVMFPVKSDEDALKCKRMIQEYLKEIPDAQIHFAITPAPTRPPMG